MQLVAPDEPEYLPSAQDVQSSTPSTPSGTVLEYLPAVHDKQVEAAVAAPVLFPETQVTHTVAPVDATNLPASQPEHAEPVSSALAV